MSKYSNGNQATILLVHRKYYIFVTTFQTPSPNNCTQPFLFGRVPGEFFPPPSVMACRTDAMEKLIQTAREGGNASAVADAREKNIIGIKCRGSDEDRASRLSLLGKSVKYGADGPRLHVRGLKPGAPNPGLLTLQVLCEPTRAHCQVFSGICSGCDSCPPVLVEVWNLDAIYDPFATSQRLAPGREIHISSPVYTGSERGRFIVRVDDPHSIEFPVVRPRCFAIGCEGAGPMLRCTGCRLVSYCGRVCSGADPLDDCFMTTTRPMPIVSLLTRNLPDGMP